MPFTDSKGVIPRQRSRIAAVSACSESPLDVMNIHARRPMNIQRRRGRKRVPLYGQRGRNRGYESLTNRRIKRRLECAVCGPCYALAGYDNGVGLRKL